MRTSLKALMLVGFGTILMLDTAPPVSAADLSVTPVKRASGYVVHRKRAVIRHRSPIVRDLDGTQIVVRRARPLVTTAYDGTPIVRPLYENIPIRSAAVMPRYYLNGQPVLPNYPRGWPRQFRSRI